MITRVNVETPLVAWSPNDTDRFIDWGEVAYANKRRWSGAPRSTTVITATAKAHAVFGGNERMVRPRELNHDCVVTDVFLSQSPERRAAWVIEDALDCRRFGGRRPDAVIDREEPIVIDVVGRGYSKEKLAALWQAFANFHTELR